MTQDDIYRPTDAPRYIPYGPAFMQRLQDTSSIQGDGAFISMTYHDFPVEFVRDIVGVQPDVWQTDLLHQYLRHKRIACSAGHGPGKTAAIAWIILHFMSCFPDCRIVVTANTQNQLTSKTWRELALWLNQSKVKDWFEWSATSLKHKDASDTWVADAIPWSVGKSEAFAGLHATNVLVVFDESSAIDDVIWTVAEGALTTKNAHWLVMGNPTRNTGRFADCFGRFRHRWWRMVIDTRYVKMTDKEQIRQWAEDYGEDSDFFRVRVRGEFPRAASTQFVSADLVRKAMGHTATRAEYDAQEKVLAVDIARFGDDASVILCRQGPKVWKPKVLKDLDLMSVTAFVVDAIREYDPDALAVDGTGMGAGVVDRLRELGYQVEDVQFGARASNASQYTNLRSELWGRMRDWLNTPVDLPDQQEWVDQIAAPEYGFDSKMRVQLERKQDMKRRGVSSPDWADALAISFADVGSHGVRRMERVVDEDYTAIADSYTGY